MGYELMLPHIPIGINVILEEILAFRIARHIVNS